METGNEARDGSDPTAASDERPIKLESMGKDQAASTLTVNGAADAALDTTDDAPVTVRKKDDDSCDGPGSGGSGGSGGKDEGTPKTGDHAHLGLAGALVGAAAAGMAIYSARRTALESGQDGE